MEVSSDYVYSCRMAPEKGFSLGFEDRTYLPLLLLFSNRTIVTVVGDQGIGKTRLLEELMNEATREKWWVIHITADAEGKDTDVSGIMLRTLLGSTEEERKNTLLPIVKVGISISAIWPRPDKSIKSGRVGSRQSVS